MYRIIIAAAFSLLSVSAAHAIPILTFGQTTGSNTVSGTRSGNSTEIRTTNTAVTVSQIDAIGFPAPFGAVLNFDYTSTGQATIVSGFIIQNYTGTFCITSGSNCSGTNYLSGTMIDVAFGQNAALTINASTPPVQNVTFTSSVITDLALERGASLSFANVTPLLTIQANTIDNFNSSVSGTFSAQPNQVPEPASLAVLGLGMTALGFVKRRKA